MGGGAEIAPPPIPGSSQMKMQFVPASHGQNTLRIPSELMYGELPATTAQKTGPVGYPGPVPDPRILIMKETCTRKKGQ